MKKTVIIVTIIVFISLICNSLNESLVVADEPPVISKETLFKRGVRFYDSKKYKMAEDYFKRNIEREPDNINALHYLSSIYIKRKKYDSAIETALTSLKIQPDSDYANMYLGKAYMGIKRYNDAIIFFRKSNKIEKFSGNYLDTGWCFYYLKNFPEAKKAFEMSNKLRKNVPAYLGLGRSFFQLNDYESSLKSFDEAKKVDRKNVWSLAIKVNIDRTLNAMGEFQTNNESIEGKFVLGVNLKKMDGFFRIEKVNKGMLGEMVGIREGDILTGFDGKSIKDMEKSSLINLINNSPASKDVEIEILRGNEVLIKILKSMGKPKHGIH